MRIAYRGGLARRKTSKERLEFLEGLPAKQLVDWHNWWKAEFGPKRAEVALLLNHYRLDPNDRDVWWRLAYALARDHVPCFQVPLPKGRSPQVPGIESFSTAPKRGPGAPRKWALERYSGLVLCQRAGVALLRTRRTGRITDEQALAAALERALTLQGAPTRQARAIAQTEGKRLAKRLPDARRALRKLGPMP